MSEDERLLPIFTEILDDQGAEIYIRPIADYVSPGQSVSFATIVAAAATRGESAFGYKRADVAGTEGGVELNPPKSKSITLQQGDGVIVMAAGRASGGG